MASWVNFSDILRPKYKKATAAALAPFRCRLQSIIPSRRRTGRATPSFNLHPPRLVQAGARSVQFARRRDGARRKCTHALIDTASAIGVARPVGLRCARFRFSSRGTPRRALGNPHGQRTIWSVRTQRVPPGAGVAGLERRRPRRVRADGATNRGGIQRATYRTNKQRADSDRPDRDSAASERKILSPSKN